MKFKFRTAYDTEMLINTLGFLKRKKLGEAEYTSSYSDLLFWKPHPESLKSAKGCILTLFVNTLASYNTIGQEQLQDQISKIAYFRDNQGNWEHVYNLCKLSLAPGVKLKYIIENIWSPEDWFGNHIKELPKIFRGGKYVNPYIPQWTSVRKPQRKRGYDDKGTLPDQFPLSIEHLRVPKTTPVPEPYRTKKIIEAPPSHIIHKNNEVQGTLVERNSSSLLRECELGDQPSAVIHSVLYLIGRENPYCEDCTERTDYCWEDLLGYNPEED